MLSDEEEILIKKLRYCEQEYEQDGYLSVGKFEAIKEAVNLIEKQQKEIEKLKENNGYHLGFIDGGIAKRYEYQDKIKARIEEYDDKGMTINLTNRSAGKTFQQAVHYEVKKVLQSLLEKE